MVQELEEDLEITEQKYVLAIQKYDKAATAADDSDRMAKVLQNRASEDEAKLSGLADELKKAQHRAEEADKKYDDAQKKMVDAEAKLEIDGERAGNSVVRTTSYSTLAGLLRLTAAVIGRRREVKLS